ncbi:MAG: hypothetical protein AB1483_01675 [Candidatus Zixiibacteriota bacterium]
MRMFKFVLTLLICLALAGVCGASEFFDKFKSDYATLDLELLNNLGERAEVTNFVYQKDIATFTFKEGFIHLLRYVDGRPTTAVFVGKGNAHIEIPSHLERQSLLSVSKDSVVDRDFEVCLIRMADDFDLKLKEQFPVEQKELKWKDYTAMMQEQGEMYFKPLLGHQYDNYFQLLRSIYERAADGYFWIDFGRYNFWFDPNAPEEVTVSYVFEPSDQMTTDAVCLQRKEEARYDDFVLSNIGFPTTTISKKAEIEMGGMDGRKIENARADIKLVINEDSARFVSTFLHYNLYEDSIHYNGRSVDYYRRKDFNFTGIILPEYVYRGDTVTLTYWYRGKDYSVFLPWVEDPTPSMHSLTFTIPKGFNYLMPGQGETTRNNGKETFTAEPQVPFDKFFIQGYASGFDTTTALSDNGITLNFLKAKHITKQFSCYVNDALYEGTILDAFNFMSSKMGNPPNTFEVYIYPENYYSMPGMVEVPQVVCYSEGGLEFLGGFNIFAGYSVSKQWFGFGLRPVSDRETWVRDAASEYLSLLFIQNSLKGSTYYTNLLNRRDTLLTYSGLNRDRPMATGSRCPSAIRCNRGTWLFHMLRSVMYDLGTRSEERFFKFFFELCLTGNMGPFSNHDVVKLAEKHYGQPLDWFFDYWLCDFGYPEFEVEYKTEQRDDGYFITANVWTKNVGESFRMPVMIRVVDKSGQSTFSRKDITGTTCTFELGPFDSEPDEFVFNELYSVLSKDKVKKL